MRLSCLEPPKGRFAAWFQGPAAATRWATTMPAPGHKNRVPLSHLLLRPCEAVEDAGAFSTKTSPQTKALPCLCCCIGGGPPSLPLVGLNVWRRNKHSFRLLLLVPSVLLLLLCVSFPPPLPADPVAARLLCRQWNSPGILPCCGTLPAQTAPSSVSTVVLCWSSTACCWALLIICLGVSGFA